jgi:hypothetical protein
MARKRKPLVVNGEIVQLDAPGLHVFERRGRVEFYWKANPTARKRGYVPRSVRLHYDLSTVAGRHELEHRCRVLTAEMLAWLGDQPKRPVLLFKTLPSTPSTQTSTRRASTTLCLRSRHHAGWQSSGWRIGKRRWTKRETRVLHRILHRSPLSIGRSAGI